jgi:hypothetical protein
MSESITLNPTVGRKIKFTGELIGDAGGKWQNGREQTRWTELELYRTESGKYVLSNEYVTCWQGESGSHTVTIFDSAKALIKYLESDGGLGRLDTELLRDAAKLDLDIENLMVVEIL